jgi:lipopolysaccharide/colanic/teichoic acid biosynthesis glycosyltransferase
MSLWDIEYSQLSFNGVGRGLDSRFVETRAGVRAWLTVMAAVIADWCTASLAVAGTFLGMQRLSAGVAPNYALSTIAAVSASVAALTVLLLANDGDYQGESGPLRIKQTERPVRVAAQASLLILLATVTANAFWAREPLLLSLPATSALLVTGKQLLFMAMQTLRAGERAGLLCVSRGDKAPRNGESFAGDEELSAVRKSSSYELWKRAFDLVFAVITIVISSPIWLTVAIVVWFDSRGSVLFCHQRVGKNGRRFAIYKFRTMYSESPPYGLSPKSSADPRITRIGQFLRRSSLDELPQLLNVIKGEMSLVGPRPEMPFVVDQYNSEQRQRLEVLPGMTGLWQLSAGRGSQIHDNIQYDLYYTQNRSFFMDLAILLRTPALAMRGI